jgi:hypothetical protein
MVRRARAAAKLLNCDEAQRIAANVATFAEVGVIPKWRHHNLRR